MGRIFHYAFVLTLIAVISAGILAYADKKTAEPIENITKKLENSARKELFPDAEKFVEKEKKVISKIEYVPAYNKSGEKIGFVAKGSENGYGGAILFMVGIGMDGKITGLKVIDAKETPGLGDKIFFESWQKKWIGRDSGYEFNKTEDAFAGATISPMAVYTGIKKALKNMPAEKKQESEAEKNSISNGIEDKKIAEKESYKFGNASYFDIFDKSGVIGCCIKSEAEGYNGKIFFELEVDRAGKVNSLKITDNSETAGKIDGKKVEEWQKKWVGRDVNYTFDEKTDAIAGATVATKAVADEVKNILSKYEEIRAEKGWK